MARLQKTIPIRWWGPEIADEKLVLRDSSFKLPFSMEALLEDNSTSAIDRRGGGGVAGGRGKGGGGLEDSKVQSDRQVSLIIPPSSGTHVERRPIFSAADGHRFLLPPLASARDDKPVSEIVIEDDEERDGKLPQGSTGRLAEGGERKLAVQIAWETATALW